MTRDCYTQHEYAVRFDWGPEGADAVGPGAAFVAVVDVLSFTTTLTVAVERGIAVLPYRWRDESAAAAARAHDATLAVGRSQGGPGRVTLSPRSVLTCAGVQRLVLPSPNGATIAARLAESGATVVGVSLRNAAAAAGWVRARAGGAPIAVVAAGERWPGHPAHGGAAVAAGQSGHGGPARGSGGGGDAVGGALRPAVEDLWGAGAFIAALTGDSPGGPALSPEARAARAAFQDVAADVPASLADCAGGRELIGNGYPDDVAVAAAYGVSAAVPVLVDGWFVDRGGPAEAGDGPPGAPDRMAVAPREPCEETFP